MSNYPYSKYLYELKDVVNYIFLKDANGIVYNTTPLSRSINLPSVSLIVEDISENIKKVANPEKYKSNIREDLKVIFDPKPIQRLRELRDKAEYSLNEVQDLWNSVWPYLNNRNVEIIDGEEVVKILAYDEFLISNDFMEPVREYFWDEFKNYDRNKYSFIDDVYNHINVCEIFIQLKQDTVSNINNLLELIEAIEEITAEAKTDKKLNFKSKVKNVSKGVDSLIHQGTSEKKTSKRTLVFTDKKIIHLVCKELAPYFIRQKGYLKNLLLGNLIEHQLLFNGKQNKLVELFRRLKYNGFIDSSLNDILLWLCENFLTMKDNSEGKLPMALNSKTVWEILAKGRGEPSPSERICKIEKLPHQSQDSLQARKKDKKL